MAKIIPYLLILLVSCGKANPVTTGTSKDSKYKLIENSIPNQGSIQIEKFQVNVKDFHFKRERNYEISLERLGPLQYYQYLALNDFFKRQLKFIEGNPLNSIDLLRNEIYKVDLKKKYEYFQELNIPHSLPDMSEVVEKIHLRFDVDIKGEMFDNLDGIEVSIWDHYKNQSFKVGFVPRDLLIKSDYYVDNYLVSFENDIALNILKNFVNRELILRFKPRLKNETNKKIVLYTELNESPEVFEFSERNNFFNYLKKLNLNQESGLSLISNLDNRFLEGSFYYLMESKKEDIEQAFPYLKSRQIKIEGYDHFILNPETIRYEFIGSLNLEHLIVKRKKKKLHTYVIKSPPFVGTTKKIKHHCYVYFWKNLGVSLSELESYQLSETDFSLLPEEIVIYQNKAKVHLAFPRDTEKEQVKLKAPKEYFQQYQYGYSHGLKDCNTNSFERTIARIPEQISKSTLTKEDTIKLSGTLISYFIPWNEIEFSNDFIID